MQPISYRNYRLMMVLCDPRKNFGEARLLDVCPAKLPTDYKSPKLVIERCEDSPITQIPLPLDVSDVFYTVTTRAGNFGVTNAVCGGHYPLNGVMEIYD